MEMNKKLLAKAKETKTPEELMKFAKENGMEITKEKAEEYFKQLNTSSGEIADDELENISGGCGGGYVDGRPHPEFTVGESVLYICGWLRGNRITASAKVVKRSYENDAWYYTLKIHDGSEITLSESYVIKS